MSTYTSAPSYAQLQLPSNDLPADMEFLTSIGFRLDNIFPADDPAVAMMSGHQMHLVLDKRLEVSPPVINIITDHPEYISKDQKPLIGPNGTQFIVTPKTKTMLSPQTQHHFEVRTLSENDTWVIGRAGMMYRDLIPNRLGGSIIASHIKIPEGGPVPDMVHYHTVGFQLIYCKNGWVKLVYEDQGAPFILRAGDCVTQPPEIRHRVLEASDGLEVIEIGVPAEHMTTIDHDMELPTETFNPERIFHGQKFCKHERENAIWQPWRVDGLRFRESGILEATKGDASAQIVTAIRTISETKVLQHEVDILFSFVLEGTLTLEAEGQEARILGKGDAFVIPPKLNYIFKNISEDFELLEVALIGVTKAK